MRCERGVRRGRKRATRSALILVCVERGPLIDGLRLISPEIANSVDVGVWADRVLWRPDKVGQTVNEKKSTGQYVTLSNAFVGPFPKSTFSPRDRDPPALLFWFVTRHLIHVSGRSRREAESEKNLSSGKKILPSRISNPLFEPVSRPKTSGKFEIQTQYFVTHRFILFAHTIYVSASPIRSGYPNQGCVTFFFYRFMRSDAGDHWRTHYPGRVYKRTITR